MWSIVLHFCGPYYDKYMCTCTVESRDYAPPFVHASIGQKRGGSLYTCGILILPCDDHYRLSNSTWACDFLALSPGPSLCGEKGLVHTDCACATLSVDFL